MKPKTDPYWWEAIERETEADPEFAESYDAVVVGAGLTGASTARTLAKNGASVLVLDAEPPGFGASTRNGGMIGEGHRVPLAQMAKRYGLETAQALLREIYIEPLNFAKKTIAEEGLDCDFKTHGRFRGQWSKQEYDSTARSLDELREIAPINVEMVPRERQRDEVGSDLYSGGLLLHDHGGLHPGKYTNELVRAARQAGARVCGNTRVTGVKPAGSGFEVSTPSGMVRAQSVLMATNGYTAPAFSWLKRRIIPAKAFVMATEELPPETIDEIMPGRRMVVETRSRHCYFRLSPDEKRLIIGGRVALSDISQDAAVAGLCRLMRQIFPQLAAVKPTHCWRGTLGFTFSFLPHLGQHDGVWHAMGYSGSGNGMAPYLGHKAALNMMGLQGRETAFTKTALETRVWHRGRAWFLPFAHALYRGIDMRENLRHGK